MCVLRLQIIEKRRRDRINNSLSELRRLVPSAFEKQVKEKAMKRFRKTNGLMTLIRLPAVTTMSAILRCFDCCGVTV